MHARLFESLTRSLSPEWIVKDGAEAVVATIATEKGLVAQLAVRVGDGEVVARLAFGAWKAYGSKTVRHLVNVLMDTAAEASAASIRLVCSDLMARNEARQMGFEGGLRQDLVLALPSERDDMAQRPAGISAATTLLGRLLPDHRVTAAVLENPVLRAVKRARAKPGLQIRLTVASSSERVDVLMPERDDLIPEAAAMAAETALRIKERFGPALRHCGSISFDLTHKGVPSDHLAGKADLMSAVVHLNAAFCCSDLAELHRTRIGGSTAPLPSAQIAGIHPIDKTTAHELGHHFDNCFQVKRYNDSIEFRRRLGQTLGVATIEKAIRGSKRQPGEPEANLLLARDVSPYATKNLNEAMAELFALWWFGSSDSPPIIQTYDRLIEDYFPPSA